jgi:hypothetical protein
MLNPPAFLVAAQDFAVGPHWGVMSLSRVSVRSSGIPGGARQFDLLARTCGGSPLGSHKRPTV